MIACAAGPDPENDKARARLQPDAGQLSVASKRQRQRSRGTPAMQAPNHGVRSTSARAPFTVSRTCPRIDTPELHRRIAADAERFVASLFGDRAKRQGPDAWRVGSKGSLIITAEPGKVVFFNHETGQGGDAFNLFAQERCLCVGDAIHALAGQYLGAMGGSVEMYLPPTGERRDAPPKAPPQLPGDATPGNEGLQRGLAALRHVNPLAVAQAAIRGCLFFGTVCGHWSWILTDERRLCMEARRMDGKPYPAIPNSLPERKAHTLKGSVKCWPVGLAFKSGAFGTYPGLGLNDFANVIFVEGGPDYLAAWDFSLRNGSQSLPVAMLGAGAGNAGIHPEAIQRLRGRRVRVFPHFDENGAGSAAFERWKAQLAGCTVDSFRFDGLRMADGSPVKDLNHCNRIHPDDAGELGELLP